MNLFWKDNSFKGTQQNLSNMQMIREWRSESVPDIISVSRDFTCTIIYSSYLLWYAITLGGGTFSWTCCVRFYNLVIQQIHRNRWPTCCCLLSNDLLLMSTYSIFDFFNEQLHVSVNSNSNSNKCSWWPQSWDFNIHDNPQRRRHTLNRLHNDF